MQELLKKTRKGGVGLIGESYSSVRATLEAQPEVGERRDSGEDRSARKTVSQHHTVRQGSEEVRCSAGILS